MARICHFRPIPVWRNALVIARKGVGLRHSLSPLPRAHFTSLRHRPQGFAEASAIAKNIAGCDHVRGIDDGPYGGTSLVVGDEIAGEMLSSPLTENADNWGGVRLMDYSVAQTAYELSQSKLSLPGSPSALEMKTALLGDVGKLGTYHLDIIGPPPRGPFDKTTPSPTATYPSLWNHNARNETRIVCAPDSQLQVRQGMEAKAATVWATASRAHLNLDFRFNSQPLATSFTEHPSIGGRAWPNVIFGNNRFDFAFAIWSNSTLGMLMQWWHSNRQQPGRGIVTIRSAESLPVLDLRTLTDDQLSSRRGNLRRLPRPRPQCPRTSQTPTPTVPSSTAASSATSSTSTKTPTTPSADCPPNGAPNPQSTAPNADPGVLHLRCSG